MSVPTAELTAPTVAPDRGAAGAALARRFRGGQFYITVAVAALVIAALSLLIPSTPSYDPWAWLVWGREIIHLDLHTPGGPSWKPLPMLFTTVFAVFGKAQPDLWLMIARAGAVVSVVMVFKLAWRLTRSFGGFRTGSDTGAGPWRLVPPLLAGLIAAGSLVNSGGFISDNALGYSEGLATALMLISVDRYLDGAPRQAFVVGFFAALDRPELWVFWGPYGLYLFWRDPGARKLVVGLFALIPVLWFLPELWGSGHLLRGVTRAQHPRSNSAAFTKCPVCTVFRKEAWVAVLNRVKIPGIIGLLAAAFGLWRTRRAWWRSGGPVEPRTRARAWLLTIGVFGFVWWLGIAVETQAGFSGNNRYLVLGTAPVAIAGGVAWGWFMFSASTLLARLAAGAAALRRYAAARFTLPAGTVVALAVLLVWPPFITHNIVSLPRTHHALVYQARLRSGLSAAIRRAGGGQALLNCGSIMTEGFQVPMVAWTLGVRTLRVEATPLTTVGPPWPNVILQSRAQSNSALLPTFHQIQVWEQAGAHYTVIARSRTFRIFSTCPRKVAG